MFVGACTRAHRDSAALSTRPEHGSSAIDPATGVADAQAALKAGFERPDIDLGLHPWYSRVPFSALFVNRTLEPLRIVTARTSCGCTGVDVGALRGRLVVPGESIAVTGEMELGGRPGRHVETVDLLLESGAVHTLRVGGDVYAPYTVVPDTVDFGPVDLSKDGYEPVEVVVFRSQEAELLEVSADSAWAEAGFRDLGSGEVEVAVALKTGRLPFGRSRARLVLHTSDPGRPAFSLWVHAAGVSGLRPVPSRVLLSGSAVREVRFVAPDGDPQPVTIERIEPSGLPVSVSPDATKLLVGPVRGLPAQGGAIRVRDAAGRSSQVIVTELRTGE